MIWTTRIELSFHGARHCATSTEWKSVALFSIGPSLVQTQPQRGCLPIYLNTFAKSGSSCAFSFLFLPSSSSNPALVNPSFSCQPCSMIESYAVLPEDHQPKRQVGAVCIQINEVTPKRSRRGFAGAGLQPGGIARALPDPDEALRRCPRHKPEKLIRIYRDGDEGFYRPFRRSIYIYIYRSLAAYRAHRREHAPHQRSDT